MNTLSTISVAKVGVLFVLFAGAACKSADTTPATTGPGTDSGIDPDAAGLAPELCPAACATVKTCDSSLEQGACEAQCAKELAGTGYLIQEVAVEYFQLLHDNPSDPQCYYTNFGPWRVNVLHPEAFTIHVNELAVLNECVDVEVPCVNLPRQTLESGCFLGFYRFTEQQRSKVRACFTHTVSAATCSAMSDCFCNTTIPGSPWVTLPPVPPDIPGSKTCPPTADQ